MDQESRDLRREPRVLQNDTVLLSWLDAQGVNRQVKGRCVDASPSGMQVESSEPVDSQTYVNVRTRQLQLSGTASVRYCRHRKMKYQIGLEFSGGLRWNPASQAE